jgi:hypothetical protein
MCLYEFHRNERRLGKMRTKDFYPPSMHMDVDRMWCLQLRRDLQRMGMPCVNLSMQEKLQMIESRREAMRSNCLAMRGSQRHVPESGYVGVKKRTCSVMQTGGADRFVAATTTLLSDSPCLMSRVCRRSAEKADPAISFIVYEYGSVRSYRMPGALQDFIERKVRNPPTPGLVHRP